MSWLPAIVPLQAEPAAEPARNAGAHGRDLPDLLLPADPPPAATIGGIVAANTTGARRLLYRLPRDSVLGVRFVTPSGEICGSGGKTVKNVSGYDVSKLAVGSMGSLGILREMTFKLLPLPETMETLLIAFESCSDASTLVEQISETSLLPASLDVLNQKAYGHVNDDAYQFDPGAYGAAVALEGASSSPLDA